MEFLKQETLLMVSIRSEIGTIEIPIGTINWDVETYRNNLEKHF